MTKYELLYGVTVDHFPNEKENVQEKLRLAMIKQYEHKDKPYTYENRKELHEIAQAVDWARKILRDIDD